jgi:AraC-like DNA-binding protein
MSFLNNIMVFAPFYVAIFWAILLLLTRGSSNRAKNFLGIFMIGASMVYFSHTVFFTNQYLLYLYIDPVYIFATMSVYPLYYWYIKLLTVENAYQKTMFWHFVPPFLFSLAIAFVYGFMDNPSGYLESYLYHRNDDFQSTTRLWKFQRYLISASKIYLFFQVVWVLYNGIKLVKNYELRLKEFYSNLEGRSVDWVKWIIVIFSLTALMTTVANILGRSYFAENSNLLFIPALVFGVLIFLIGYLGHLQRHSVYDFKIDIQSEKGSNIPINTVAGNDKNQEFIEDRLIIKNRIIELFEKKRAYENIDLKISSVCEMLNTNRTYLSNFINEEFACSFSDLVNNYRVAEAQKIILADISNDLTLEQIAEKVGFASAGTLIRNFKIHYKITPGSLRKKNGTIFRKK